MSSTRSEGSADKIPKKFITGSSYNGELNECGMMNGFGVYTFPNGDVYEGEFRDGEFHGEGVMTSKGSIKMRGTFSQGHCENYEIIFEDGLIFQKKNWGYCQYPDRRFYNCIKDDIPPVGKGYNTARCELSRPIPQGFFDTEDGFFDPVYGYVWSDTRPNQIIRWLSCEEQKTVIKHYRGTSEIPIGYQQNIVDENVLAVLELFEDDSECSSCCSSSTESSSIWENDSDLTLCLVGAIENRDSPYDDTTMVNNNVAEVVVCKKQFSPHESPSTSLLDQSNMEDSLLSSKSFVPTEKSSKDFYKVDTDYILNGNTDEGKETESNESKFQGFEQDNNSYDFPSLQWKTMERKP